MDPITQTTATGLEQLMNITPVVTVLVLVIVGGFFVGKSIVDKATTMFDKALEQCEKREERAIANWERANERGVVALEKCSESYKEMSVIVARLEAKINK